MHYLFDEFSKSLSQSVPRRESLRRLGAVFAGAVLTPLGLETAWAAGQDPCKAFCKCANKKQQDQCLTACRACNGDTSRLAGSCGSYTCCSIASCKRVCSNLKSDPNCGACGNDCRVYGETCCGSYCADLKNDVFNCGRCGVMCNPPGPYEFVACVAGSCIYDCVEGAVDCNGTCTFLELDPDNCGACGNVCPDSARICNQGTCSECDPGQQLCGNTCTDVNSDPQNCGACGNVCPESAPFCNGGECSDLTCPGGATNCFGVCTNIYFDNLNCGGCGIVCGEGQICSGGICQYPF